MGHAFDQARLCCAKEGLDVDTGRCEERTPKRDVRIPRARASVAEPGESNDFADEREAVGMQSGGWDSK